MLLARKIVSMKSLQGRRHWERMGGGGGRGGGHLQECSFDVTDFMYNIKEVYINITFVLKMQKSPDLNLLPPNFITNSKTPEKVTSYHKLLRLLLVVRH